MATVRERGTLGTSVPQICHYIAMKCRNSGDSLWMRYKLLEEQRIVTSLVSTQYNVWCHYCPFICLSQS